MGQTERPLARYFRLSTFDLAVAGVFGALAVVLAGTPLGMIPVPNPTGAATSLHIPAIIAGILAGPLVGSLVGLVLAVSSWVAFSASFMTFTDGNLLAALLAAFLPRMLIGVAAYWTFRLLRHRPVLASAGAALAGTLTNSIGVIGLLFWLGAPQQALTVFGIEASPNQFLAAVFSLNVPIEIALALVVTIPTVAALKAVAKGRIAALRD